MKGCVPMKAHRKVVWAEGIFLGQQHFQRFQVRQIDELPAAGAAAMDQGGVDEVGAEDADYRVGVAEAEMARLVAGIGGRGL